jgi:hypothetical protein
MDIVSSPSVMFTVPLLTKVIWLEAMLESGLMGGLSVESQPAVGKAN